LFAILYRRARRKLSRYGSSTATRLTTQFAHFSIGAVEASSAVGAQRQWTSTVTAYLDL